MPNVKTLTTIAIAALFAAPAFAQDTDEGLILDTSPDTVTTDFASADLDQNGSLNADEFVTFAVMRAEGGDEVFKDIVMGGEYDATFAAHDADASGGIEASELVVHDGENPEMIEPEGEEIIEPDM
ncbi:MAG: hypothetical protein ABJN22_11545 [Litorimonas sp.]